MIRNNKIEIPFKGLADGNHDFECMVTDTFFTEFEYSELLGGKLNVAISMEKRSTHLNLIIKFEGMVNVTCDRCLDSFDIPVEYEGEVFVRFGEPQDETDEGLIVISPDDSELDLSHYIYESVCLSLPYQKVHPKKNGRSTCNKDMIKKLKQHQQLKAEPDEENDPRWDALKNL